MKTLFLFEDGEGAHFIELEGDHTEYEGVYINGVVPEGMEISEEAYEARQESLALLMYGEPDVKGEVSGEIVPDELEAPTKDWDHFVRCGCLD